MPFIEELRWEIDHALGSDAPLEHRSVRFYVLPGLIVAGIPVDNDAEEEQTDMFTILGDIVQSFNPSHITFEDRICIRYDAVLAFTNGSVAEMYLKDRSQAIEPG